MNTLLSNKDEIIMSLVHYFVTEENYTPINVQGAKNEVWLENLENPIKIVRINSKYIHNDEQYNMDLYKMNFVMRQIKRKTLSFKMNALNICLDLNNTIKLEDYNNKYINTISIDNIKDIAKNSLLGNFFPKIKTNSFKITDNLEQIINVTQDINKKTSKENDKFEDVFRPKKIIMTKIIMLLCVILYLVSLFLTDNFNLSLIILGANHKELVMQGEFWRIFTNAFLHGSLWHLLINMYSLWIIGTQVENYIGKVKFLIIYILSIIMASLFSLLFLGPNSISIGASGAIFGLMGALLYFGYHYRLYLGGVLKSQIIPIIIVNLFLGFSLNGIDNAAHIGGLIGGYLATMAVGLKYKSNKSESINGIIVYILLCAFLIYALFRLV